tara:strand:+ start:201 stop:371 length:171 start_codon:yes stop_codon:yes gene_type:complete
MKSQLILKENSKFFKKNTQADKIIKKIQNLEKQRDFLNDKLATEFSSLIKLLTNTA